MKIQLTLILFFAFSISQIQAQESASEILEKAYVKAQKENKNVFVKFTASWCGWCKKMDKQMKSEECKDLFDANYVSVSLVVQEYGENQKLENAGGEDLKNKYHGKGAGLPYWLIFDKNGKLIADANDANGNNTGCPATKSEVETFIKTLKKTSKLTDKELAVIYNTFYEEG